jgi:hypothetical protein
VQDPTELEKLRQAVAIEREKARALEKDLEAARERDSRYAATVTEEIEKGEWALKQWSFCKCAWSTVLSVSEILLLFYAYVGRSHTSSVSIVTWLQAEQRGIWVQFPAGTRGFPLLYSVPLGTYPGLCLKCSRGFSPKDEVAAL